MGTANPSEVGVFFRYFFAALNLAVIDTVMGHVNVHIDCHLIICYASLCSSQGQFIRVAARSRGSSRMRRNHGNAAAHHSTHNTQHHTHTCQHQQQAHQQRNTPQKQNTHQAKHRGARRRRRCACLCRRCQSGGQHRLRVPCCEHRTA